MIQVWAYCGSLASIWFNGKKSIWGPIMGASGFFPWSYMAYQAHLPWMIAFNLVITALHVRTIILWRRNDAP